MMYHIINMCPKSEAGASRTSGGCSFPRDLKNKNLEQNFVEKYFISKWSFT